MAGSGLMLERERSAFSPLSALVVSTLRLYPLFSETIRISRVLRDLTLTCNFARSPAAMALASFALALFRSHPQARLLPHDRSSRGIVRNQMRAVR
jgi:hypothetical protein